MRNSWTGGQYSWFRILLAAQLLCSWLMQGGLSSATPGQALPASWHWAGLAVPLLCLLLGIGFLDRMAAAILVGLWWICFGHTGLWQVGVWLLMVHCFLPSAPFGSWAAGGRTDPGGSWSFPGWLFALVWACYTIPGVSQTLSLRTNVMVGILVFGTAWFDSVRPWTWAGLLLALAAEFALAGVGGSSRWLLAILAFDPGWIPPYQTGEKPVLFYDGHCGLCHRAVRFVLAEDQTGEAFRFAPLDSAAFREQVPEAARQRLPDSLVIRTSQGILLTRWVAVTDLLNRLGGSWRVFGTLARVLVPRSLGDALYDGIARLRHRLFRPPQDVCPLLPPHLRSRFEA
ncbi:MAG: DCC1-like thiol-disulfide oxidoreductase family protein [Acidobacteriota bacterium]